MCVRGGGGVSLGCVRRARTSTALTEYDGRKVVAVWMHVHCETLNTPCGHDMVCACSDRHSPVDIPPPSAPRLFLPCRRQKKLTEYEKWEYKQLMMSGVLDVREFPLFDEENGMGVLAQVDEVRRQCVWHKAAQLVLPLLAPAALLIS